MSVSPYEALALIAISVSNTGSWQWLIRCASVTVINLAKATSTNMSNL